MNVRISVALATYNGERFITEQINSILNQTVPVSQIVIADDGSTDHTIAKAREALTGFAGDVVLLPAESRSLGVTKNFERALRACTGDIIALADQDDVWHPEKLARMSDALGDGLLAFSDAELVDEQARPFSPPVTLFDGLGLTARERQQLSRNDAWTVLLRRNVVTGATAILRRELLELAGDFPDSWVHDEWLAIVAAAHGGVRLCDEATIAYRQHGGNQIGMRTKLTLSARIERLRQPRAKRNERLYARADALATRAQNWPGTAASDTTQKLEHEKVRLALPASRIERIAPVLREKRAGRYDRFGLGAQDVLRDLVQPAR